MRRRDIDDPRAPELAPFHGLLDRSTRGGPVVLVEGETSVRRLLGSTWAVDALLATPAKADLLEDLLPAGCSLFVGDKPTLAQVVGHDMHRGCVAATRRPAPGPPPLEALPARGVVVVAEELADPANVGALIRNARAFGAAAVLVDSRGADPFEPRAIRASMGNVFAMPVWVGDVRSAVEALAAKDWTALAATVGEGAVPVGDVAVPERMALLLGNEGRGLSQGLLDLAAAEVTVPLAPGADSLNVAAASAVLLHCLR